MSRGPLFGGDNDPPASLGRIARGDLSTDDHAVPTADDAISHADRTRHATSCRVWSAWEIAEVQRHVCGAEVRNCVCKALPVRSRDDEEDSASAASILPASHPRFPHSGPTTEGTISILVRENCELLTPPDHWLVREIGIRRDLLTQQVSADPDRDQSQRLDQCNIVLIGHRRRHLYGPPAPSARPPQLRTAPSAVSPSSSCNIVIARRYSDHSHPTILSSVDELARTNADRLAEESRVYIYRKQQKTLEEQEDSSGCRLWGWGWMAVGPREEEDSLSVCSSDYQHAVRAERGGRKSGAGKRTRARGGLSRGVWRNATGEKDDFTVPILSGHGREDTIGRATTASRYSEFCALHSAKLKKAERKNDESRSSRVSL